MDAPDELRTAIGDAIYRSTQGVPWSQVVLAVDAVLAVPAIADALRAAERDAKVAEIVRETLTSEPDDADIPVSYFYADGFDDIAALYPEATS